MEVSTVSRRLIIHIGLPKTATTTLQEEFFSLLPGFLGKDSNKPASDPANSGINGVTHVGISSAFDSYLEFTNGSHDEFGALVGPWIESLQGVPTETLLISDESLSSWPIGKSIDARWVTTLAPEDRELPPRRGRFPIVDFLEKIKEVLPSNFKLQTIVTLRNQSDYLGSLAAETAGYRNFDKNYLEKVIRESDKALDFAQLVQNLETVCGSGNHLTLLFEDGIAENIRQIANFLGSFGPDEINDTSKFETLVHNRRQVTLGSWVGGRPLFDLYKFALVKRIATSCRSSFLWWAVKPLGEIVSFIGHKISVKVVISISPEERAQIRATWEHSNNALAKCLNRNLTNLGY